MKFDDQQGLQRVCNPCASYALKADLFSQRLFHLDNALNGVMIGFSFSSFSPKSPSFGPAEPLSSPRGASDPSNLEDSVRRVESTVARLQSDAKDFAEVQAKLETEEARSRVLQKKVDLITEMQDKSASEALRNQKKFEKEEARASILDQQNEQMKVELQSEHKSSARLQRMLAWSKRALEKEEAHTVALERQLAESSELQGKLEAELLVERANVAELRGKLEQEESRAGELEQQLEQARELRSRELSSSTDLEAALERATSAVPGPEAEVATKEQIQAALAPNHSRLLARNAFGDTWSFKSRGDHCRHICEREFYDMARTAADRKAATKRQSGGGRACEFCQQAQLEVLGDRAMHTLDNASPYDRARTLSRSEQKRQIWVSKGFK